MTLEVLQKEMIAAMKAKDKVRKDTISGVIGSVKKMGIDKGCRNDIPEEMVNNVLIKEVKTMQEMIDTCPADRVELFEEYKSKMNILNEFAPKLITDKEEIKEFIKNLGIDIDNKHRGDIMKAIKGKVDMKIANEAMKELLY